MEVAASMVGEILTVQEAGGFPDEHCKVGRRIYPSLEHAVPHTGVQQGVRLWQIILEIRLRTIIILIFQLRRRDFYVKGSAHCDWGMKNRLGKMFDPRSGNTVMLAFDHGYIMGPTAGLERIDLVIPPLIPM